MIINKYKGLDVELHYEKLDNGLEVYLIPYENRNNYSISYITKYGAKVCDFISANSKKRIKVPRGVAHFLEHKMFEQEDGVDPFAFFSRSGCDGNAYTNYDITAYTAQGTKDIEKNLDFLLDYVNSPYFTDENVEKEKGIIIEELNMYKDQPENKLYDESGKALFVNNPVRYDIGGTSSSVKKITKEILYDCYNTFYQPSNMFLIIAGKFDCEKIEKIIKNNKKLNSKKTNTPIKYFMPIEPILVNRKEKEIKISNLIIPKAILSIKSPVGELKGVEKYKYNLSMSMMLYILFGMSSSFREYIDSNELCSVFYSSSSIVDNVTIVDFTLETEHPYDLKDLIFNCLKNTKITEEDVERVKKVRISLEVMDTDMPGKMGYNVRKDIVNYDEIIYDKIDIIREIKLKDILKVKDDLMLDNYSFVIGYPK